MSNSVILPIVNKSGQFGVAYNLADWGTLYKDTAGTDPITANGQGVGAVDDLSDNGLPLAVTDDARPVAIEENGERYVSYESLEGSGSGQGRLVSQTHAGFHELKFIAIGFDRTVNLASGAQVILGTGESSGIGVFFAGEVDVTGSPWRVVIGNNSSYNVPELGQSQDPAPTGWRTLEIYPSGIVGDGVGYSVNGNEPIDLAGTTWDGNIGDHFVLGGHAISVSTTRWRGLASAAIALDYVPSAAERKTILEWIGWTQGGPEPTGVPPTPEQIFRATFADAFGRDPQPTPLLQRTKARQLAGHNVLNYLHNPRLVRKSFFVKLEDIPKTDPGYRPDPDVPANIWWVHDPDDPEFSMGRRAQVQGRRFTDDPLVVDMLLRISDHPASFEPPP